MFPTPHSTEYPPQCVFESLGSRVCCSDVQPVPKTPNYLGKKTS